jgi:hypothetical protein
MNTGGVGGFGPQRRAQPGVGGEVERGEAVVEDVDVGPPDDGPRNRQALLLPARQVDAALRDRRRKLLRHRLDEVDGLRHCRSMAHFVVGRVLAAIADVGGDGSAEEHGRLRHEPDARAKICLGHLAHVDAVEQHLTVDGVVEARNQPGEGRFSRSGAADDGGDFAGMRRERHTRERRFLGAWILKGDVAEFDVPAPGDGRARPGRRLGNLRLEIEHLADARCRRRGPRQHDEHRRHHEHREQDLHRVLQRREHGADLHHAGVDAVAGDPDDRDAGEIEHEDQRRHEDRYEAVHRNRRVGQVEIRLIEPLALPVAAVERADDADAAQPLAEHEVESLDLELHGRGQRHCATHDQCEHHRHHRHHRDQHPRELRVLRQRQDDAADRHHRRRDHHGEHHDDHLLHLGGVVGGAGDQRGRSEPIELVDRQALGAREDGAAQVPSETRSPLWPNSSCRRSRTRWPPSDISSISAPTSRMAR